MAIPVIDFSKLNGEEREKTLSEIAKACEEWGFFQLMNHGIPLELLNKVKTLSAECYKKEREEAFKTSSPVKLLNELVQKTSGEKLENVDWEDVFTLLDHNQNEWPSNTSGLKEAMGEYREEVRKLASKMMEVMDENLGLPKGYIKKAFNEGMEDGEETAFFGTKVSHYPPCPHPERVNGLRAHTDAGGVVLLFQDDEYDGLQVLKDGEWIDVQPLPNAIVINTGDQIEVLSNGRYKSAWHRGLAREEGNRRSIASFYNPSYKAAIGPAVVAEEGSENKYPKFVFGDYMDVYANQKFMPKEPRFLAVKSL
ncbi:PREDICTED: 1-aminocyclopropane-1-carboxylate oxidase 5 [Camelina sativa]|uniref:1-aminocyclopropane-1-carboxylate oxidase 5 n=1 Tax=Camelina sativa TaxID=90675 RepID=A0ABM0SVC1_CAMSA|nr:PREDICTED: 1-aminocyclopropane-1-carboxylate oxidase 5 [Camelina sativa]